jgi:hypothetical protein
MLNSDKNISERLEKVRLALNLGKGEMADKLGIYPQDYSKFFPGSDNVESKRKPATLVVELLNLGVNANWYLTGVGEMFLSDMSVKSVSNPRIEEANKLFMEAGKLFMKASRLMMEEIKEDDAGKTDPPGSDSELDTDVFNRMLDPARKPYSSGPAPDLSEDQIEYLKRLH